MIRNHFCHEQAMQQSDLQWLVITDDDTMLGVSKILELIHFYDRHGTETEPIALGERYGHSHAFTNVVGKWDTLECLFQAFKIA